VPGTVSQPLQARGEQDGQFSLEGVELAISSNSLRFNSLSIS
jgi:hypothetical protein